MLDNACRLSDREHDCTKFFLKQMYTEKRKHENNLQPICDTKPWTSDYHSNRNFTVSLETIEPIFMTGHHLM